MRINLLLTIAFLSILIYANINYQHGINGMTLRDGGTGCVCHQNQNDSVIVWIEGQDSVVVNDTIQFRLVMTGGPAIVGGYNVASFYGELNSLDTLTQIISGELTHTLPNPFIMDTVFWNFSYKAPDSVVIDTLYSVGNSTNGDGNPQPGDQWNFGANFILTVIDEPVYVENKLSHPDEYILYQNYPNPFNPTTNFKFRIADFGFISIKVFDLLGREVTTLVNEEKPAGEYEVKFDAKGQASGIYLYKLETSNFTATRKMLLLK